MGDVKATESLVDWVRIKTLLWVWQELRAAPQGPMYPAMRIVADLMEAGRG